MGFGKLGPIQGHAAVATCRSSGSGRDSRGSLGVVVESLAFKVELCCVSCGSLLRELVI